MLERYVKLWDAILTVSAVDDHVPRGSAHRRITAAVEKLKGADIIHSPDFEMAIVKIQNDLPPSSSEEDAVEDFVVEPNDPTPLRVLVWTSPPPSFGRPRNSAAYLVSQRSTMSYCASCPLRATRANDFSLSANWC
ncbi:hypothetical protein PC123_g22809 [Phytophthora cactorum]|nr:hypothetical protein PC123_g22809 [Phytophthora cactorum]